VNGAGEFQAELLKTMSNQAELPLILKELELEFDAQIQKCLSAGLNITHLDSHANFANKPAVIELLARVAAKYALPVRGFAKRNDIVTVDHCTSGSALKNVEFIIQHIELCRKMGHGIIEIYLHPTYIDGDYLKCSPVAANENWKKQRERDVENACSPKLLKYLQENNVKTVSYGELRKSRSS